MRRARPWGVKATMKTAKNCARKAAMAAACTLALQLYCAPANPAQVGPVPKDFFGMTLINRANWPTVPFGALGKGTFVNWIYIERHPGIYDWSNLDAWVATAEQRGVDFLYSIESVPKWATSNLKSCTPSSMPRVADCSAMPKNLLHFDAFIKGLVTRYKGRIKNYELWNEPYQAPALSAADLVTLTQRAYHIIRDTDPQAKIISPSLGGHTTNGMWFDYADRYYTAGGVRDVDVMSFHPYPDPAKPVLAELLVPNRFLLKPALGVISKHQLNAKPLWATEGSWNQTKSIPDPDLQAAFVARFMLLAWSNNISRMYWYAWDNDDWGTLWNRRTGTQKAAKAYHTIYRWMVGAVMSSNCAPDADNTTWSCGLTRPSYKAIVVWNVEGDKTYVPSAEFKQYRTLDSGAIIPVAGPITIGQKPILIETGDYDDR